MLTYKSERVSCVHLWINVNANEHRGSSKSTSIPTVSESSLVRNVVMKFGLTSQVWKWNIADGQHTVASFPICKDALFLNTVSQANNFIKESHNHSLCLSHRGDMEWSQSLLPWHAAQLSLYTSCQQLWDTLNLFNIWYNKFAYDNSSIK